MKIGEAIMRAAVVAGMFAVGVLITPLVGAIVGWFVGLFFGDTILNIAGQLGVSNITMWQLGAFLGFIGGFLKTGVSHGK